MYKKRENFVKISFETQHLVVENFLRTSFSQIIESLTGLCYSYIRPKRSIYVELGRT